MKKIYLQPEMELTESVMLRAAVCSGGGYEMPEINDPNDPFGGGSGAPAKKVF
jgi:hypothetical protein